MPHVIEVASSGRAKCRGCGGKIAAGEVRVGERLPNPYVDEGGEMTHWFHPVCAAYRRPEAFLEALETAEASAPPIADREVLVTDAQRGVAHHRLPRVNGADRAPTGRATCRSCKTPIDKGAWRIALVFYEDGRFAPAGFIHARCAAAYFEATDVLARIAHFSPGLSVSDQEELAVEIHATG